MKKKILFTAFNLDIGGVEKCLVNLVNNLDMNKYNITIYLQVKEGVFLNNLDKNITVKGYNLSKIKNKKINNKILKLIVNTFKYIKILIKNYHKYDCSICYAPGYVPSSILALLSSKNNIAWMHTNLITYMENYVPYKNKNWTPEKKVKKFVNRMYFRKYNKKIFVSSDALCAYLSIFPQDKKTCHYIYNLTDYKEIIKLSKEKIKKDKYTFINVGRHTEFDKRLTRIINSAEKLVKEGYKFNIAFIGDGEYTNNYKKLVKEKKLDNYIKFLGRKSNPYPYFLNANYFILSSEFEGLPTTLIESLVLNIPIITTDISDAKLLVENNGIVVDNSENGIYTGMKQALDNKIKIKDKFNPELYNKDIINKLESVINNE